MSSSLKAQDALVSKYQSFPLAIRQKLEFQDSIQTQLVLLSMKYQQQVDSLMAIEMDGREKWEQLNTLTEEKNTKLSLIRQLVELRSKSEAIIKREEQ